MLLLFYRPFYVREEIIKRVYTGSSMENIRTYPINVKSISNEHDYCCNFPNIDNNNNGNGDGNESKGNVPRTKYHRAFNVVDKWVDNIISRVPTGNDTRKIVDREIIIHKVKYPFLPEQQIRGKVYKKFGIPSVMGGALNKKIFRRPSPNTKKRKRLVTKMDLKEEQEDSKPVKKYLKSEERDSNILMDHISSGSEIFDMKTLKYENPSYTEDLSEKQGSQLQEEMVFDTESSDVLSSISPLNIEDLKREKFAPFVEKKIHVKNLQIHHSSEKKLKIEQNSLGTHESQKLKNPYFIHDMSIYSQPTQITIPNSKKRDAELVPNLFYINTNVQKAPAWHLYQAVEKIDLEKSTTPLNFLQMKHVLNHPSSGSIQSFSFNVDKRLDARAADSTSNDSTKDLKTVKMMPQISEKKITQQPRNTMRLDHTYSGSRKLKHRTENVPNLKSENTLRKSQVKKNSGVVQNYKNDGSEKNITKREMLEDIESFTYSLTTKEKSTLEESTTLPFDEGPPKKKRRFMLNSDGTMTSETFQKADISAPLLDITNLETTDVQMKDMGGTSINTPLINTIPCCLNVPLSSRCSEFDRRLLNDWNLYNKPTSVQSTSNILKTNVDALEISNRVQQILEFLDKDCGKD